MRRDPVGHSIMEVLTRALLRNRIQRLRHHRHDRDGTQCGIQYFSTWFAQIGWFPLGGLALANSLATALEATALFIFMRKRLNGIEGKSIANSAWRVALAALGMGIGLGMWTQSSLGQTRWLIALGGVAVGGVIYLIGVTILKVPEIQILFNSIARRLLRRKNAASQ
ncbi:MAG: hypothetical protein U0X87_14065 [Anaerolineales bacterium]